MPLVTIALIYFMIACLLLSLMALFRRRLTPETLRRAGGEEKQMGGSDA